MNEIRRNYEYIKDNSDISRVVSWLSDKRFYLLDTETSGLNPFQNDVILLQIGNEDKQWIIDCRSVNIEPLRPFAEDPTITKLGQHIKHDIKFLNYRYKWDICNVVDTMINEQILRCGIFGGASMETLAERYLRIQIDKDEELRTSFKNTGVGEFSERQLNYASGDVLYPLFIARKQKPLIQQRGLAATLMLEYKVIPVLARMELAGMGLDVNAWNKLYQESVIKKMEVEKQLNQLFHVTPAVQMGMFGQDDVVQPIDYNSPHQVKKALTKLGYILPKTDKWAIALAAIEGRMPVELAQAILSYRKYFTRITRYGAEFLSAMEEATGRIHSDFTQALTTSGRLSSKEEDESESDKVNLQNIPSVSEYRSCFIPRPGYVYVIYDYQAIEPRILGELSHDPTYLHAFDNDLDLYQVIGEKILKEEVSKRKGRPAELRDKTKITVLGNSYGTGKDKFFTKMLIDINLDRGMLKSEIKKITREESDNMWEKFFEICPNIKETLDELSNLANPEKSTRKVYDEIADSEDTNVVAARLAENFRKWGNRKQNLTSLLNKLVATKGMVTYSETLGGRKRHFKVHSSNHWTEGRNHPIQGTAADILKTAMVNVDDAIRSHGNDAMLINQVHDELIIEVKEEEAQEVDAYVKPILLQSESKFLKRVPPKVEGGIKRKWEK
jgi:DNA polymerase I